MGRGRAVRPCKLWGPAPETWCCYTLPGAQRGEGPACRGGALRAGAATAAAAGTSGAWGGLFWPRLPPQANSLPSAPLKLAGSFPAPPGPDPAPSRGCRGGCFPAGLSGRRVLPGDAGWGGILPMLPAPAQPRGVRGPCCPLPSPFPGSFIKIAPSQASPPRRQRQQDPDVFQMFSQPHAGGWRPRCAGAGLGNGAGAGGRGGG